MTKINMELSRKDLYPYYHFYLPSVKEKVRLEFTRFCTEIMASLNIIQKWNRLTDHLYLGQLPAFSQQEQILNIGSAEEKSKEPSVDLVISVVNYYELAAIAAVSPASWKDKKVAHYLLPITDFTADVTDENIIATVLAMRQAIQGGKSIYVHCKAGKSRSAMLCAIYLYLFGDGGELLPSQCENEEIENRLEKIETNFIKKKRGQVGLELEQRTKAKEVIQKIKAMQREEKLDLNGIKLIVYPKCETVTSFTSLLNSSQLKNAIIHFSSFKELAIYGCQQQGIEHIQQFFSDIYHAEDQQWFIDLISKNPESPLQKLINMASFYSNTASYLETMKSYAYNPMTLFWNTMTGRKYGKSECERLRDNFIEDLKCYFREALHPSLSVDTVINEIISAEIEKPIVRSEYISPFNLVASYSE